MISIVFEINESEFEIFISSYSYDPVVGGDSYSEPGWGFGINGYSNRKCELYSLQERIEGVLNLNSVEIIVGF
ncbi:hypothetical protein PaeBR_06460 [Paenibacillus sp. BR2-3]|uniref:hypothetical protein n=1 Tax=Paenibacillus sp. BR2-3 TaxID=3048494 RepID=UPI0039775959